MGKLSDFLGGFAGGLAKTMRADEEEKRRAEELKASQKAQLDYVRAAEAIRANFDADRAPKTAAPQGQPVQGPDGTWTQPMGVYNPPRYSGEEGGYQLSEPASVAPADSVRIATPAFAKTAAPKTREVKLGDSIVSQEWDDVNAKWVDSNVNGKPAVAQRYKANVGGGDVGGADRRAKENNTRRDRDALSIETERRLADIRAEVKDLDTKPSETYNKETGENETGPSELDNWLQANGMPMGQSKAQALDLARRAIRSELAPQYGADNKADESKPKSESKSKEEKPPVPGAKKADDGKWYVQKGGKWFLVN